MNPRSEHRSSWLALVLTLAVALFCQSGRAAGTNILIWHHPGDRVDADISSCSLLQLLESVSAATGWRVYLDPSASHNVSAKFQDLSTGEALHALLGGLNFAVVPQSNSVPRLYVFRTSQRQATRLVHAPRKPAQPIPNQFVVTLKPGSKTKIEDLAKALNAKIIGRMDSQNAYLLQFQDDAATQAARQSLANNPDVAGTDVNYPFDPPPVLNNLNGSTPGLQLKPKSSGGNGQLVVEVIDTAYQANDASYDAFVRPQIHVAGDVDTSSSLTHGTAMIETVIDSLQNVAQKSASATGAPQTGPLTSSVQILPVDVYGNSETTTTFNVANGIIQAVNNGANIINLSLGGTGDSQFLHNIITQVSQQQGIPIYAAAGNEPVTTPTYPAAYPEVISVTATDSTGKIASYANYGSFVNMTAPGDNVVPFNGQTFLVEGTSTATALASGAAAGLADAAHVGSDKAEALLQSSVPRSTILKPVR